MALLCDTLEYLRSGHEDKDDTITVKTDDTNKAISPSPYPIEDERPKVTMRSDNILLTNKRKASALQERNLLLYD